jgi:hypothetical protein
MLKIKEIAATLAILGSGALVVSGCNKDKEATETPGGAGEAKPEGSCGGEKAEGSCGGEKKEGSCGGEKTEGSCGGEKTEGSCGGEKAPEGGG